MIFLPSAALSATDNVGLAVLPDDAIVVEAPPAAVVAVVPAVVAVDDFFDELPHAATSSAITSSGTSARVRLMSPPWLRIWLRKLPRARRATVRPHPTDEEADR